MSDNRISSPNLTSADQFAFEPERVEKPWGHELIWALSEDYAGKFLSVNAGHELSLQFHREKDESWYVLKGRLELHFAGPGEKTMSSEVVTPGAAFRIRPGTVHRVRALVDSVIVEVSTPQLDDVVRLEDSYGRADAEER